jgi:hypothetical protein
VPRGDIMFVVNGGRGASKTIHCFEKGNGYFNREQRWEACRTYLNSWFWEHPTTPPDLRRFVDSLVVVTGNDGNHLVNLALAPDGSFEPNLEKAVEVCGAWMARYGVAIYGSRGGPRQGGLEGKGRKPTYNLDKERKERFTSTGKGKTIYLFVLDWAKQDRIEMPALPAKIVSYKTLSGGNGMVENDEKSLRVTRPKEGEDTNAIFTCFAIELDQEVFSIPPVFGPIPRMRDLKPDLARAGIPYKDEDGRQADLHALRMTFGTTLAKAGVAPRTAMQLMRHTDLRLTMSVYTDPTLLDMGGAVESLPDFSRPPTQAVGLRTGTDDAPLDISTEPKVLTKSTSCRGSRGRFQAHMGGPTGPGAIKNADADIEMVEQVFLPAKPSLWQTADRPPCPFPPRLPLALWVPG